MISTLIFSRNRALQLNALLESIAHYTDIDASSTCVLYHYDDKHARSLQDVMDLHPNITFLKQHDFQAQVNQFVDDAGDFLMFLVDDILFKDDVQVADAVGLLSHNTNVMTVSYRLGLHLKRCYPLDSEQPIPRGEIYPPGIFVWNWREASMDWSYPLSVDGHIFRKDQFKLWINGLTFNRPNKFEEAIQIAQRYQLPELCVCYAFSKLVNLPINRVQVDVKNRHGDVDTDHLLSKWEEGLKLDNQKYDKVINIGAHDELELFYTER